TAVGRSFRSLGFRGHRDVPARAGAGGRHGSLRQAVRGTARHRARSVRTLFVVGAGKMGSAMLDGWLARGLKPKQIVVIEPHPAKTLKAPAKRGLKLNPKSKP